MSKNVRDALEEVSEIIYLALYNPEELEDFQCGCNRFLFTVEEVKTLLEDRSWNR